MRLIPYYYSELQSNMRVSMVEVSFSVIKASTIHKMWANSMESTLNPTSSENVFLAASPAKKGHSTSGIISEERIELPALMRVKQY